MSDWTESECRHFWVVDGDPQDAFCRYCEVDRRIAHGWSVKDGFVEKRLPGGRIVRELHDPTLICDETCRHCASLRP